MRAAGRAGRGLSPNPQPSANHAQWRLWKGPAELKFRPSGTYPAKAGFYLNWSSRFFTC